MRLEDMELFEIYHLDGWGLCLFWSVIKENNLFIYNYLHSGMEDRGKYLYIGYNKYNSLDDKEGDSFVHIDPSAGQRAFIKKIFESIWPWANLNKIETLGRDDRK
jgi:hypothetical protein